MDRPIRSRVLPLALAGVLALPPLAAPARATEAVAPASAVGINAAVGCGIGVRVSISTGGNAYIVAATIAVCALMIFEALRTPD